MKYVKRVIPQHTLDYRPNLTLLKPDTLFMETTGKLEFKKLQSTSYKNFKSGMEN